MKVRFHMIYEFNSNRFDPENRRLFRPDEVIDLGPKIAELLALFVRHPNATLEKDWLIEKLYPEDENKGEENLAATVANLRRKLGEESYIETVAGRGYKFVARIALVDEGRMDIAPAEQGRPHPPGGAVPLDSAYYIVRKTDEAFHRAIAHHDSIVLVRGPRQVGKTSLLARGLQAARESGAVVVHTDLQHPSREAFASLETLLLWLAGRIASQLNLKTAPRQRWSDLQDASTNFEEYLRLEVLGSFPSPMVWALDEIDRLFDREYAEELFGLFRTWHNLRALEPSGPWRRMTLAIAYATETNLFINNKNQSPFNVGVKLTVEDFSIEQSLELNDRHGAPLASESEMMRLTGLIGGHPYLLHRAFYEMTQHGAALETIEATADRDEGIFGEHLRRMWFALSLDPALCAAMRDFLEGKPGLTVTDYYRLHRAGLLLGDSAWEAKIRCPLYERFLRKHLL